MDASIYLKMFAAIILSFASISAAFSIGIAGSKYLEGIARQPEAAKELRTGFLITAGFIEAIPLLSVVVALLLVFTT